VTRQCVACLARSEREGFSPSGSTTTASAAPSNEDRATGLTGLADRVEALGGALELESPPGAGTRLVARFPIRRNGDAA
jgi:signal transduction histidine kinase